MVFFSWIAVFIINAFPYGMTRLAAGTLSEEIDQYCSCYEVANSGANDYMVPHNSSNEWMSFINAGLSDITSNVCANTYIVNPTANFIDINTSACSGSTDTVAVNGLGNNPTGGNFYISSTGNVSSCTIYAYKDGVSQVLNLPATLNMCQNSLFQITLDCPGSGAKTGTIVLRKTSQAGPIRKTVNVAVNSGGGVCP